MQLKSYATMGVDFFIGAKMFLAGQGRPKGYGKAEGWDCAEFAFISAHRELGDMDLIKGSGAVADLWAGKSELPKATIKDFNNRRQNVGRCGLRPNNESIISLWATYDFAKNKLRGERIERDKMEDALQIKILDMEAAVRDGDADAEICRMDVEQAEAQMKGMNLAVERLARMAAIAENVLRSEMKKRNETDGKKRLMEFRSFHIGGMM